jgi:hypothetical protein
MLHGLPPSNIIGFFRGDMRYLTLQWLFDELVCWFIGYLLECFLAFAFD